MRRGRRRRAAEAARPHAPGIEGKRRQVRQPLCIWENAFRPYGLDHFPSNCEKWRIASGPGGLNRTRAASGAEGQSDRTRERLWVREGEEKRKEKKE